MLKFMGIGALLLASQLMGYAQENKDVKEKESPNAEQKKKEIPSIKDFFKGEYEKHEGMFNVYVQNKKYYVEIPDRLLGRDIFVFTSIVQGSAQLDRSMSFLGYAGDALISEVVRFEKGPEGKLFLKQPIFSTRMPEKESDMYNALKVTNLTPIIEGFDVKAKGDASVLVDFTAFYGGDNNFFSLKPLVLGGAMALGAYQADKSYPTTISTFENNVIFRAIKSYAKGSAKPLPNGKTPQTNPTTWEIASSWYLLPEEPMQPRYVDARVGYFASGMMDYDKNPHQVEPIAFARRWRLEPKKADLEKYRRGELVEPEKPIVFYVDRNTPEYLRPYIIAGVEEWQQAFERIGFKNAIQAKMMPTEKEDPNFSPEDARYSIISYKASPIPNAYGPHVADPRSGEIICSHIGLFHNVLNLARTWYFAQCAHLDPRVRKFPLSNELMGELMQFIVTHEVGHTLGLRHNFAGSWTFTLDEIKDRDFVKKYGHGASVMDYMRFNYAAEPKDKIAVKDLIPKLGDYDRFAIEWGYRYFPEKDAEEVSQYLTSWVTQQRQANPRVFFGTEMDKLDPRFQAEDLSNNTIKADELGMKNLEVVASHLFDWTEGDDEYYTTAKAMFQAIYRQYMTYRKHVLKYIGGRYANTQIRSEGLKENYIPVSKATQEEAMQFLVKYAMDIPDWLLNDEIVNVMGIDKVALMERMYQSLFNDLLLKTPLLVKHEQLNPDDAYTLNDMFEAIYQVVFQGLENGVKSSVEQQLAQKVVTDYLLKLLDRMLQADVDMDIYVTYNQMVKRIADGARLGAEKADDRLTKVHLQGLVRMYDFWLTRDKSSLLQ